LLTGVNAIVCSLLFFDESATDPAKPDERFCSIIDDFCMYFKFIVCAFTYGMTISTWVWG